MNERKIAEEIAEKVAKNIMAVLNCKPDNEWLRELGEIVLPYLKPQKQMLDALIEGVRLGPANFCVTSVCNRWVEKSIPIIESVEDKPWEEIKKELE
jgi:hypothetical protein